MGTQELRHCAGLRATGLWVYRLGAEGSCRLDSVRLLSSLEAWTEGQNAAVEGGPGQEPEDLDSVPTPSLAGCVLLGKSI